MKQEQNAISNFVLYGAESNAPHDDMVHYEPISLRASLFDFEIKPHVHRALIQVLYITHGGGETSIDGRTWTFQAPCLIAVPAQSVHNFHFANDIEGHVVTAAQPALESVIMALAPDLLEFVRTPAVLSGILNLDKGTPLETVFQSIRQETLVDARWQLAAGAARMIALFVKVGRLSESAKLAANPEQRTLADRIEKFRALLDKHCRERRAVGEYAKDMGVTTGQLSRICHAAFGTSAIEAIDARSIHEAKRLLGYSTMSVKQIANELGFQDEAYFGRFFRKQVGERPTEYRSTAQERFLLG
ncbi:AraC family transcriptional activator of pobA [Paraburkholderia youngii]|uniref:AraC family transcriptional activator of pobA n=2 Tax=Paraburkholderia youngii TaxID=2782701 RepID=A0A7W8L0H3_9BURK|nr:helix-turn-helix domain-containing protein [Paraburkholderia youngii]MBB5398172.1 AraC family transcriptional activator of pobA [Paraburkholderia youngii]NUX52583.1 helix-turn-helix domain-containing protein [Paraburkholderia youngii]NVI03157.1 helix-turn-helix domain-containing protein [Paraburkholderia youngii]